MPALMKRTVVLAHGPQADLTKAQRSPHELLDDRINPRVTYQFIKLRRRQQGVVVGALVVSIRMPKIGIGLQVRVEQTVEISHLFIRQQLAEVDKAMVAKKLFLFSVHGASISKGKGAGITQRIERKLRIADKVNTGKHRILLVV